MHTYLIESTSLQNILNNMDKVISDSSNVESSRAIDISTFVESSISLNKSIKELRESITNSLMSTSNQKAIAEFEKTIAFTKIHPMISPPIKYGHMSLYITPSAIVIKNIKKDSFTHKMLLKYFQRDITINEEQVRDITLFTVKIPCSSPIANNLNESPYSMFSRIVIHHILRIDSSYAHNKEEVLTSFVESFREDMISAATNYLSGLGMLHERTSTEDIAPPTEPPSTPPEYYYTPGFSVDLSTRTPFGIEGTIRHETIEGALRSSTPIPDIIIRTPWFNSDNETVETPIQANSDEGIEEDR